MAAPEKKNGPGFPVAIVGTVLVALAGYPVRGLAEAAFALVLLISAASAVTTFLMCGFAACPDNPTGYLAIR